jgi:predicted ester cyclase
MTERGEVEARVRLWVDTIWNQAHVDRLHEFHPPTWQDNGRQTDYAHASDWHRAMRQTYAGLQYEILDVLVDGDRAAFRWEAQGRHVGLLWGQIEATGKQITWTGMHLVRLENGLIVDIWAVADTAAVVSQLPVRLFDERRSG